MKPSGHTAVMNQRSEALDAADDFPTPPWATRALIECVLPQVALQYAFGVMSVWEPAAGRKIMSGVLGEYTDRVWTSDVHQYDGAPLDCVGSFVGEGPDVAQWNGRGAAPPDWVITNPPFRLACEFFERAIDVANMGVALLVRSNWAEGADRYARVFAKHPPLAVAQFVERVPMVRGRWDPDASTATAYAWFVWLRGTSAETRMLWIPPGQRKRLTRPDDARRFCQAPQITP